MQNIPPSPTQRPDNYSKPPTLLYGVWKQTESNMETNPSSDWEVTLIDNDNHNVIKFILKCRQRVIAECNLRLDDGFYVGRISAECIDKAGEVPIKIMDFDRNKLRIDMQLSQCETPLKVGYTRQKPTRLSEQFLMEGNIKKTLETILQYAKSQENTELKNDCALQLSRLSDLENRERQGAISQTDYNLEKNKIRVATQVLIGKM